MLHSCPWAHQGFLKLLLTPTTVERLCSGRSLIDCRVTYYNHGRRSWKLIPRTSQRTILTVTERRSAFGAAQRTSKNLSNLENATDQNHLVDTTSLERTLDNHKRENAEKVVIKRIQGRSDPNAVVPAPKHEDVKPSVRRLNLQKSSKGGLSTDYNGVPQSHSVYWSTASELPLQLSCPWLAYTTPIADDQRPSARRLAKEIVAARMYFTPTRQEAAATRRAISDLTECILGLPKTRLRCTITKVNLIGSRASGFAHAMSDIDLNLVTDCSEGEAFQRTYVKQLLKAVYTYWRYNTRAQTYRAFAEPLECLTYARVPIVTGLHTAAGLDFQLQSASSGYGSLGFMKLAQAEYPTILPLFHVIKQMLNMRNLCEGAQGGLTSYPVFNMILASLKLHATPPHPGHIGRQLIDFLEFWSTIDTYKVAITHIPSPILLARMGFPPGEPIRGASLYAHPDFIASVAQDPVGATPVKFSPMRSLGNFYQGSNTFDLVLHDPANPYNNLGRSTRRFKDVQATMYHVLEQLRDSLEAWDQAQGDIRGRSTRKPILGPLIQGNYTNYTLERKKLAGYLHTTVNQVSTSAPSSVLLPVDSDSNRDESSPPPT